MGVIERILNEAVDDRSLADVLIAHEDDLGLLDVLLAGGIADFLVVFLHV